MTTLLAYSLIAAYFVVERSLRKDKSALSLQPDIADNGSSRLLLISGFFGLLLAIYAPLLNRYQLGYWPNTAAAWSGIVIMVCGLTLRYWPAKTLGKFYTRTLCTAADQRIIEKAPYNLIRHPGYLGTLLLNIGAGLALMNWIVLLIGAIAELIAKIYRIDAEEKMLMASFSDQFRAYQKATWRLIPFIY